MKTSANNGIPAILVQALTAIALIGTASMLNPGRAQAQQEVLWVMKSGGGPYTLYFVDPMSGQVLGQNAVVPDWGGGNSSAMTFDGTRLVYAVNIGVYVFAQTGPFGGPASQLTASVPTFGVPPWWCGLYPEFDPV